MATPSTTEKRIAQPPISKPSARPVASSVESAPVKQNLGKTSWAQLLKRFFLSSIVNRYCSPEPEPEVVAPPVAAPAKAPKQARKPVTQAPLAPASAPVQKSIVVTLGNSSPPKVLSLPSAPASEVVSQNAPAVSLQVKQPPTQSLQQQQPPKQQQQGNLPPGLLQNAQPAVASRATPSKKPFRQDAAVVMPSNAAMTPMGVQFGSLRVAQPEEEVGSESAELKAPQGLAARPAVSPNKPIETPQAPIAMAPQAPAAVPSSQHYPNPAIAQPSYFPGQQIPGFGMVPGAGAADFGHVYGNEAQLRAAASLVSLHTAATHLQGYYSDPYQSAQKFQGVPPMTGADPHTAPSSLGQTQPSSTMPSQVNPAALQQAAAVQQQYAVPFGYYPYYMPSQYSSGGYPSYGQFVGKNVYQPYPQGPLTGTVTPPTGTVPAAALPMTAAVPAPSGPAKPPVMANGYAFSNNVPVYAGTYDESLSMYGNHFPPGQGQGYPSFNNATGFGGQQGQNVNGDRKMSGNGQSDYKVCS